ncbi:MAG TPA: hypothetical protein VFW19_10605 [Allosphingosinicella sp.]|nr:hypothetical protein [Allosphingosinicella sp.]
MPAPSHTPVAPELPADSIDFNALHNACLKGLSPEEALAACWPGAPANAAAPASPAPPPAAPAPSGGDA